MVHFHVIILSLKVIDRLENRLVQVSNDLKEDENEIKLEIKLDDMK